MIMERLYALIGEKYQQLSGGEQKFAQIIVHVMDGDEISLKLLRKKLRKGESSIFVESLERNINKKADKYLTGEFTRIIYLSLPVIIFFTCVSQCFNVECAIYIMSFIVVLFFLLGDSFLHFAFLRKVSVLFWRGSNVIVFLMTLFFSSWGAAAMTCSLIMVFTHGYQYPRKNKVKDVVGLRSFYERISAYTDDDIKRIIDDGDDAVQLLRYAVAFGMGEKSLG